MLVLSFIQEKGVNIVANYLSNRIVDNIPFSPVLHIVCRDAHKEKNTCDKKVDFNS